VRGGAAHPSGTAGYNSEEPSGENCASAAKKNFAIFSQSFLCTQGRWNPERASMLGAAARYRQAIVGSSHDDAHPDNSTLHMGTFFFSAAHQQI
jgi:hypothetical protein